MEQPLDDDAYDNWISRVFPSSRLPVLVGVSVLIALGAFALGFSIARLGADDYLDQLYPYVGAGATFWILLWLGWVDSVLVDVWNRVAASFDVESATYRDVVGGRLAHFYDDRVTLGYSLVLLVPYLLLLVFFYFPSAPGADLVDLVVQPGVRARLGDYSLARIVNYALFGTLLIPALVTSVRGFVQHVFMLHDVAALPFQNIHTAAMQLEPLVQFSITPATAWFVGVSLVVLWMRAGVSENVGVLVVTTLVLIGLLHIAVPLLILHDALQEAKQELLSEIRADFAAIHGQVRDNDGSLDHLSLWLDVTDQRLQQAKTVSTWVYDIRSVRRFVVASVLPIVTLLNDVLTLLSAL